MKFDGFSGQALHMKKTVVGGTSADARAAALAEAPPGVKSVQEVKTLGVDQSLIRAKRVATAAGRAEKAITTAFRVSKLPFDHETRGLYLASKATAALCWGSCVTCPPADALGRADTQFKIAV